MSDFINFTPPPRKSVPEIADEALQIGIACGAAEPLKAYELIRSAFAADKTLPSRLPIHEKLFVYKPDEEEILDRCPICRSDAKTAEPYFCGFSYRMGDFEEPFSPAKLWMKCPTCGNLFSYGWAKDFLHPTVKPQKMCLPDSNKHFLSCKNPPQKLHVWGDILAKARSYTDGTKLLEPLSSHMV